MSHIVIPYRGSFVRRVGSQVAHADVNQALFFNAAEEYRIDHFTDDGDACLSIDIGAQALTELAEHGVSDRQGEVSFRRPHRRIEPALQLQAARLRHSRADTLLAEEIALHIVRGLLSTNQSTKLAIKVATTSVNAVQRRLVRRAKQALHADPRHRWSLSELAGAVATSPVYLTQTFSKVEGVPLYRYQTQLRLALALQELPRASDLAALALDLGFSSHSQFTTAFKRMYGLTPSAYQRSLKNRKALTSPRL